MGIGAEFDSVLEAARVGADWAWRVLYAEMAGPLHRYARASSVPDAEDVVGDVFLRAVAAIPRFQGDERSFRAWLFTLARNRIADDRRKAARRRTEPAPAGVLAELGPCGDAEQEAMRALADDRIRALLSRLSADQRDVLLLRILAGFTIEEVAAIVGKRAGAVKALQARALAAIHRDMAVGAVTL